MDIKTLDQIKNQFYGPEGTPERDRIENELRAHRIGLQIRTAREKQSMTQEELARRVGKKRSFISFNCFSCSCCSSSFCNFIL